MATLLKVENRWPPLPRRWDELRRFMADMEGSETPEIEMRVSVGPIGLRVSSDGERLSCMVGSESMDRSEAVELRDVLLRLLPVDENGGSDG